MHRSLIVAFACAVAIVLAGSQRVALAKSECEGSADRSSALFNVVDKINARGFAEASDPFSWPWDVTFSPLAQWYTEFLVQSGTDKPLDPTDQAGARTLTGCLSALTGAHLTSRIWLNPASASYDATRVRNAAANIGATLVELQTGADVDVEFDKQMTDWIVQESPGFSMPHPDYFIRGLNNAGGRNIRAMRHPFRALSLLTLRSELNVKSLYQGLGFSPGEGWYYADGKIQGVRFDSAAPGVSMYIFVGDDESIAKMCKSLDTGTWRAMITRFVFSNIYAQPIHLDVANRTLGFRTSEQFAYGTALFGGVRQTSLALDRGSLMLSALTGISGFKNIQMGGPLITPRGFPNPFLSSQRPMLYIVEDQGTGVILFIGEHLNRNVTVN